MASVTVREAAVTALSDDARADTPAGRPVSALPPPDGHVDVTGAEGYRAYAIADMAAFGKFGGRFLVRGGARELPEGRLRSRSVLLEFPSYQAAVACYRSPDYQAAKKLRDGNADVDLLIVEGYDGPQP